MNKEIDNEMHKSRCFDCEMVYNKSRQNIELKFTFCEYLSWKKKCTYIYIYSIIKLTCTKFVPKYN